MRASEKFARWQEHFEQWQKSGLSQRNYCQQNGLAYSSFGYWWNRLKTNRNSAKLIPVTISRSPAVINVYLPCGVRIETPIHSLAEVLPLLTGRDR